MTEPTLSCAIRAARPDDAEAVARLSTQLGYPATPGEAAAHLATLLADPTHAVFVAEVEGAVAGWLDACAVARLESAPYAEIGGLVVDEVRRGQGIGERLVEAAAAWAAERG